MFLAKIQGQKDRQEQKNKDRDKVILYHRMTGSAATSGTATRGTPTRGAATRGTATGSAATSGTATVF